MVRLLVSEDRSYAVRGSVALEGLGVDEELAGLRGRDAVDLALVASKEGVETRGWVGEVKDTSGSVGLGRAGGCAENWGALV